MGQYTNGTAMNAAAWVTVIVTSGLSLYLAYVASGVLAQPGWAGVLRESMAPRTRVDAAYVTMLVGLVGTTIAPWMQFYQQAAAARGEPAVRNGAARERGRRRSAYEAPNGSVAPGPVSSGAESKRRRCPRSRARARQSRVTLLV